MASFSWAAVLQAVQLYFAYKNRKKGEQEQGEVVGPVTPKPKPPPEPKPEPPPVSEYGALGFHHYNPRSWEGRGSSIIMCEGAKYDRVLLNGVPLHYHGEDKGRSVWTDYDTPRISGEVIAHRGDRAWVTVVDGTGGMQYGTCPGQ